MRCFLSKVLNCDPMRITKKYTGNSSIGKRTFMPLMRSAENVAFIDSSRAELALLRTIWINKLFLTEKNGSRKAAKASLSPADKAAAHPRGSPAKQQQHPSLSPSTSAIDLEQWNRLIASGDLSNPLLQQLLASASASMMKPSSSPFESQEDSTADAEGDADDNDSADGASLSLSSSTTSDSPSLSLMSTVHRLKPKVSGSRHSESLASYGRLFTPVGPQASSSSSSSSVHDAKSLAVLPPRVLAQMSPTDFSHYQAQLQQFRLEQAAESSSAAVRLSGSKRPVDEDAEDEEGEATKYRRFDAEDSLNGPNDTLESAALALLGLCQR